MMTKQDMLLDCQTEIVKMKEGSCHADPVSARGKRLFLCRLLSPVMVPLIGLLIFASLQLNTALSEEEMLKSIKKQLQKDINIGKFVHALQLERVEFFKYLYGFQTFGSVNVSHAYSVTTERLQDIGQWPLCGFESSASLHRYLEQQRANVSLSSVVNSEIFRFYSDLNECILDAFLNSVGNTLHRTLWKDIIAYKMIVRTKENVDVYVTLGNLFFTNGNLTITDYIELSENERMLDWNLKQAMSYSEAVIDIMKKEQLLNKEVEKRFNAYRGIIKKERVFLNASKSLGFEFKEIGLQYLEYLRKINKKLEERILYAIDYEYNKAESSVILTLVIFLVCFATAPIVIKMLHKVTTRLQEIASDLSIKSDHLEDERKRAQSLLHQMLPKQVATQLQLSQSVQAEYFDKATVYFCDVVGFTNLSAKSSPIQVVDFLNSLYNMYDVCLDRYDVYKVETIGDAYMVVSGVPVSNGDDHVSEIALMSLDLMERSKAFLIPHLPDEGLKMRMGFHTGKTIILSIKFNINFLVTNGSGYL